MNDKEHRKSLGEVHGSVNISGNKSKWRKIMAFLGPAYLVSVGYMDPGNWATDIAGGSQFGYALIWVLLMSNLMALLLQSLATRLGIVRGLDLAQASREAYPRSVNFILYLLAEIAIAACDLAEVLGMAIGLQLLFGIPMIWGVSITVFDSFLLLFLINKGIRKMEAFIIGLIVIIGLSFFLEMFFAKPDIGQILTGFIPSLPGDGALYIAIGIIGATVMPHNLYLHSSLVQTRKIKHTKKGIVQALKYNFIDSVIALNFAFFVNAAILIVAAAVFYKNGMYEIAEIQDAHKLLEPLLGTKWAPILFALALIAAGQSSTITGTLAGQIVMEGYLNLRIQPWVRLLLTRLIAIIPALFTVIYFGEQYIGQLLVLSQVVLSLQLGFAIIPLIHFVSDKKLMKGFHIKLLNRIAAWAITIIIVVLNAKLVLDEVKMWLETSSSPIYIWLFIIPIIIGAIFLLIFITIWPLIKRLPIKAPIMVPHIKPVKIEEISALPPYKNIAIAIDFSASDSKTIASALQMGGKTANYSLIHVVETPGALVYGNKIKDYETSSDKAFLNNYKKELTDRGYHIRIKLGFGSPKRIIPQIVNADTFDLLIMGRHGHAMLKDLIFGTTIDRVRHKVNVPLFIV